MQTRLAEQESRKIVDLLHDNKLLKPEITRGEMRLIEDVLADLFDNYHVSAIKVAEFNLKIK